MEIIQSHGVAPKIVEYLVTPPDPDTLLRMAELVGVPLADLLRRGEAIFQNAGENVPLEDANALASWLHEHPQALERPIVIDEVGQRAVVGRPPENVESLLKS